MMSFYPNKSEIMA